MDFNDLLRLQGFDPATAIVLRHRPYEERLNRVLPWLAAERHDLFNAYQQIQSARLEASMGRATHLASFIGHAPGKALFVGLYAIGATETQPMTPSGRAPRIRNSARTVISGSPRPKR